MFHDLLIYTGYITVSCFFETFPGVAGWRWLSGWVVGKTDFNENPVVSLDLDFGLRLRVCQNLRYTASEGRLKLMRESDSYRLLFNGYQKKEDIATSGGYSVVIDNLNCPHLRVQFPMSRIKEFFDIPLKGTQSLSMIFCET